MRLRPPTPTSPASCRCSWRWVCRRRTTERRTKNSSSIFPGEAWSASLTAASPTPSASTMWPAIPSPMRRRPPFSRPSPPCPWRWWWTLEATRWTTSALKRDGAIWRPVTPWRTGSSCFTTRSSPRSGRLRTSSCRRRRSTPSFWVSLSRAWRGSSRWWSGAPRSLCPTC